MQRGTKPTDPELPMSLRDQEILDRSKTLAGKIAVRERLVADKKVESKKRQREIDEYDAEIARLARIIEEGFENRAQGDLFVDQVAGPTKDEAHAALAEVGAMAEGQAAPAVALNLAEQFLASLGGERPEEHQVRRLFRDFCADKGVRGAGKRRDLWDEVQALATVASGTALAGDAAKPLPSEPHPFEVGQNPELCQVCGSGAADPVHAPEPEPPAETPAEPQPEPTAASSETQDLRHDAEGQLYTRETLPVGGAWRNADGVWYRKLEDGTFQAIEPAEARQAIAAGGDEPTAETAAIDAAIDAMGKVTAGAASAQEGIDQIGQALDETAAAEEPQQE